MIYWFYWYSVCHEIEMRQTRQNKALFYEVQTYQADFQLLCFHVFGCLIIA